MDRRKPLQILLVEDNPDDVEITRRALIGGCRATALQAVGTAREALDYLFPGAAVIAESQESRPDLILLDLNLPEVDGLQVLATVRASRDLRTTPVVILTASDRDEDVVKSYELGANSYIQKPVEFEEFRHAVEVLGEYWGDVATLPRRAA